MKHKVYVQVESPEQAEKYKAVLKALGEDVDNFGTIPKQLGPCKAGGWWLSNRYEHITGYREVSFGELVELLTKKEKPLLISKDGHELFVGDEFWTVSKSKHNRSIEGIWGLVNLEGAHTLSEMSMVITYPEDNLAFKSKKAAKKFIKENKPLFIDIHTDQYYTDRVYADRVTILGLNVDIDKKSLENMIKTMEALSK